MMRLPSFKGSPPFSEFRFQPALASLAGEADSAVQLITLPFASVTSKTIFV